MKKCLAWKKHSCNLEKTVREKLAALPAHKVKFTSYDEHMPEISAVYAALADAESREVFLRALKARMMQNAAYLPKASAYREYNHPLVRPVYGETVCDGGLKEGDSAQFHALSVGPEGKVYAFEPEPTIASVVQHNLQGFSNVHIEKIGLWSEDALLHIAFAGPEGGASKTEKNPPPRSCHCGG